MILTHSTMTLAHYHDFYYLQALQIAITNRIAESPDYQFKRSVERLTQDIESYCDDLFGNIALRTFLYLYATSYGEARHASQTEAATRFIDGISTNRHECYANITNYPPTPQNIKTLVDVFGQKWQSSFGGRAWQKIAESLLYYYKAPPAAFIDHVIDLEHNGGCVFSKNTRELCFDVSNPTDLKKFLDYKFRHDILTHHPQFTHVIPVMRKTYALMTRYATIFNQKVPYWVRPALESLTDYVVEWGNMVFELKEKWAEWVTVTNGNVATPRTLMYLTQLHRVNLNRTTKGAIPKIVEKAKKKIYAKHKKAIPADVGKMFDFKAQQWERWAIAHSKFAKVYSILPCKFRLIGYNQVELQIPVPYQGIGIKTDYGFKIEAKLPYTIPSGFGFGYEGSVPQYAEGHLTKWYGIMLSTITGEVQLKCPELEAYFYD